jgi:quercetin dioxygenase-like cupin family protein
MISNRITITCAELEKGSVVKTHTNKGSEWALLIEGEAVVKVKNKHYPMEGGDAIFSAPIPLIQYELKRR